MEKVGNKSKGKKKAKEKMKKQDLGLKFRKETVAKVINESDDDDDCCTLFKY